MDDLAADEMATLLMETDRFKVIERGQLQKLLDEQNLEGIVKPGELAKPGQVRGIDYLLFGRVTNFRMKTTKSKNGVDLAGVGGVFSGFGTNSAKTELKTECGVDIRLVQPSSGEVVVASNSEFNRAETVNSQSVRIMGAAMGAENEVTVDDDTKGKILRMALNDALHKAIPKIDRFLASQPQSGSGNPSSISPSRSDRGGGNTGGVGGANSALGSGNAGNAGNAQTASKKFCPHCGKEVAAGSTFCPNCGGKVQ
jgi:curli biogenesis system outer membrane secretion channel CsgG